MLTIAVREERAPRLGHHEENDGNYEDHTGQGNSNDNGEERSGVHLTCSPYDKQMR